VFSHIYLDNLKPGRLTGYRAKAAKNALAVDNFFADFFFSDINWLSPKSWKLLLLIDFSRWSALIQCPTAV